MDNDIKQIKDLIRTIPDFPHQGIMFRDVTTLFQDPAGLNLVAQQFQKRYLDKNIDVVVGIEARGFILASIIALSIGKGFVPARKKGKLPGETVSKTYALEYGQDTVEMHVGSIKKGQKVLLVDDLIATGGTAIAAAQLIEELGGELVECSFLIDLPDIGGSQLIKDAGYAVFSLIEFEGE